MNQSSEHTKVVNDILLRCGARTDCRLWKNHVGIAKTPDHTFKFGLKGSADILGIGNGGTFIALEVKTGKAAQSPAQKSFQKMVDKFCGIYAVVGSAAQAEKVLDLAFGPQAG